jgi:hypothetical protein
MNWVRDIKRGIKQEVIAIDGKTIRGMARNSNFNSKVDVKSIHVVSAWAAAKRLVFGQVKAAEKSNEITAIPVLLESIALVRKYS